MFVPMAASSADKPGTDLHYLHQLSNDIVIVLTTVVAKVVIVGCITNASQHHQNQQQTVHYKLHLSTKHPHLDQQSHLYS